MNRVTRSQRAGKVSLWLTWRWVIPLKLVQVRQHPAHGSPDVFRPATYPGIMTTLEMLIDVLSRSRERFDRAFDGVTLEQANTRPAPDLAPRIDSLTWLAWHTARELDIQVAPLGGVEPVWVTGGHRERFALPLPDNTQDWRHTPEEAAQVVVSDLSLLFAYLDDAYALATTYLRSLTPETLDDIVDDSWDPPVTRAVRLASVVDDAAQHSGQAVYTRRLLGLPG